MIKLLLTSTLPLRCRLGLTRHQLVHNWRKHVSGSHPLLLTTDLFPEESKILLDAFERTRPSAYLEVGVFWGGTFRNVLKRRDELGLGTRCVGIDIWDELIDPADTTHGTGQPIKALVHNALKRDGRANFEFLSGLSNDVGRLVDCKFDMVFHDANHTYAAVIEDIERLYPVMSDGALMLVHNAGTEYEPDKTYVKADGGPYQAVVDLDKQGKWKLLLVDYRMAVLQRLP